MSSIDENEFEDTDQGFWSYASTDVVGWGMTTPCCGVFNARRWKYTGMLTQWEHSSSQETEVRRPPLRVPCKSLPSWSRKSRPWGFWKPHWKSEGRPWTSCWFWFGASSTKVAYAIASFDQIREISESSTGIRTTRRVHFTMVVLLGWFDCCGSFVSRGIVITEDRRRSSRSKNRSCDWDPWPLWGALAFPKSASDFPRLQREPSVSICQMSLVSIVMTLIDRHRKMHCRQFLLHWYFCDMRHENEYKRRINNRLRNVLKCFYLHKVWSF